MPLRDTQWLIIKMLFTKDWCLPSTKEAYNLQERRERLKQDLKDYINSQKTLMVNVPGEITSMCQNGSEVKINYK